MKIRHRLSAFLLAMTMVLSFMPAAAFADDADAAPEKIIFSAANPVEGHIGSTGAWIEKEGNSVSVRFSNGKTKTYTYIVKSEGDETYEGFYLDGDAGKERADIWGYSEKPLAAGSNSGFVEYSDGSSGENVRTAITITGVSDADIKSASFVQKDAINIEWSDRWDWSYDSRRFEGDKLSVQYKDAGERVYTCTKNPYEREDDDDCSFVCKVDGEIEPVFPYYVPDTDIGDWKPGGSYTAAVYINGVKADGSLKINVGNVETPVKAEIIQAKPARTLIGLDHLDTDDLCASGNRIRITYDGDEKKVVEYKYQNHGDDDYGFFYTDKDGERYSFWGNIYLKGHVRKGTGTISGMLEVGYEGPDGCVQLPVSVKTSARKYYAYVEFRRYTYTGKKITPKAVVKYWNGKKFRKMPAKWYTYKAKKNKKIGNYYYKVNIKKKYQKKFGKSLLADYNIVPKTPVIKSVRAGEDSLTVNWKKFSVKEQKTIDEFVVEYSTSKKFKNPEYKWVNNRSASGVTINRLEKGKTYYVRVMSSYHNLWSKESKVLSAEIK